MTLPPFAPENLGDATRAILPQLQVAAESRMRWTCRVERGEGEWVEGPDGYQVPGPAPVIYRGPFRVGSFQPQERTPDVGGSTEVLNRERGHFPAVERMPTLVAADAVECDVAAMPFRSGDRVVREVDGQDSTVYRITAAHETTDQTAQRPSIEREA